MSLIFVIFLDLKNLENYHFLTGSNAEAHRESNNVANIIVYHDGERANILDK
ncbi:MAG: hypothetical protein ACTSVL_10325 [Promethearchaeota archaeon]